jgi:hypothetical protein
MHPLTDTHVTRKFSLRHGAISHHNQNPGLSMEKTNGDNIQHYYTTIANAIWYNVDTLHQKPISEQTTARTGLIVANELVMELN